MSARVLVLGGGFAGLAATNALAKERAFEITLLERTNHHTFQPLLYQVATAGLSPADIASPLRAIVKNLRNVQVRLGEVVSIDPASRRVRLSDGTLLPYDFLLLATGATHSYFGHPEWALHAPGLKTIEDATEIRRRVLLAFELAENSSDAAERARLLTFVVVGGGPTGVELAGAISELAAFSLARDFRRIRLEHTKVILVEAGPRLLAAFSQKLSDSAAAALKRLRVHVRLLAPVTSITGEEVVAGGERIATKTVVWAAGVVASPLAAKLGVPLDRVGRVLARPDLSIAGFPNVFVAGDLVALPVFPGAQVMVPGVAPAAMQQGRHAARNILARYKGRETAPFRYRDKGNLATIGRAAAVAEIGRLQLSGFFAWLVWLFIHIWFLIGFRNRVAVLFNWAWHYITYQRGARLILEPAMKDLGPAQEKAKR